MISQDYDERESQIDWATFFQRTSSSNGTHHESVSVLLAEDTGETADPADPAPAEAPTRLRRTRPSTIIQDGKADIKEHLTNHALNLKHEFMAELDDHYSSAIRGKLGKFISGLETEEIFDSLAQHKYAKLAEASYQHYKGLGAEKYLQAEEHAYAGVSGFRIDEELSSLDDLVLHNPMTGETVVSYRGTVIASDWFVNARIANPLGQGGQHSGRYIRGKQVAERAIEKYGRDFITTTGHSQGAGLSSYVAQELDISGHHYDPAISLKQIHDNGLGKYKFNNSRQVCYRPTGDVVSINTYAKSIRENFQIKNINSLPTLQEKALDLHQLDMFHPTPKEGEEVAGTSVKVIRNTKLTSLKGATKAGLDLSAKAMTAYETLQETTKDLQKGQVAEAVIDTGTNVGEFYGAEVAFGAGSALGESALVAGGIEVAGLAVAFPVAVGVMGAVGATVAIELASEELKKTKFVKDIDKGLHDADKAWGKWEDHITGTKNFAKKARKYNLKDLERDTKHGYHKFKRWLGL